MKKIKFLLIIIFFNLCNLYSQNVIFNGGFEVGDHLTGHQAMFDQATLNHTADYLDNWIRAEGAIGEEFHTTDWRYSNNPGTVYNIGLPYNVDYIGNSSIYFDAASGYGMIGMAPAELIQQGYDVNKLKNLLDGLIKPKVTLKFKIRLTTSSIKNFENSTKLSFYLSKKKLDYKSNNTCANSNKYHEFSTYLYQFESIYNVDGLVNKFPSGSWHQVEQEILLPENYEDYDWLAINLNTFENGNKSCGDGSYCCTYEYVYLDDIELIVGCEDSCSKTDGPLNVQLWGNLITSSNYTRITNLNNVSSLTFKVYATNGDIVYTNSVNCINGIGHDIYWDGKSIGGSNLANEYYKYEIIARNDCYEKLYSGTIVKNQNYTGSIVSNFSQACENGPNITPEECCLIDEYLDNLTLIGTGNSNYIIKNNIWVCTNTPDYSDEVKILSNANILYQAGSQIVLAEGFNTELGANFLAQIEPCNCEGCKIDEAENDHLNHIIQKTSKKEITKDLDNEVNIYPNPTNGILNISLVNISNVNYELYALDGRLILNNEFKNVNEIKIDLSNNESGVYFLKLNINGEIISKKIIKE